MLRNVVLAFAVALFAVASVSTLLHPEMAGLLLPTGVLLLGTLLERTGYGRAASAPPAERGWRETAERFVDPETGRLVAVWFDAATGERRYVDDGVPPHRG